MSTFNIKGFASYPALVDNAPGEVSAAGEISPFSLTYSAQTQQYENPVSYPLTNLTLFTYLVDGAVEVINPLYGDFALQISTWIYEQATFGNFSSSANAFLQALTSQLSGLATLVTAGAMIKVGNYYVPEYIQYSQTVVGTDTSVVRLWFVDQSFQNQFDSYELRVIGPSDNVDDLFAGYASVLAQKNAFSIPNLMDRVDAAADEQPYTFVKSYTYNYVNPVNTAQTVPTTWTVIGYGQAGNNLDAIKAAFVTWILANSQYSQAQWSTLLPDLFLVTEFIVIPRWDGIAIPSGTLGSGFYSPMLPWSDAIDVANTMVQGAGYTASGNAENMVVFPVRYKSMIVQAVAGPLNDETHTTLLSLFPDYINVPSIGEDVGRMSDNTQLWVTFMDNLLAVAEAMTEYSSVPAGYQRVSRNGIYYASASFGTVSYLMVPLAQLTAVYPQHTMSPS